MGYVTSDVKAGVEYDPRVDRVYGLANWRAWGEDGLRPAFILGTSSDRIGTPYGQAFYGTFSKSLKKETGIPVAPYVGTSYGTFDDKWELIGGGKLFLGERVSTGVIYDGLNRHHHLDFRITDTQTLTVLLVAREEAGLAWSIGF